MEKDLEKYIKFLAYKTVQIVVQSRLGEKLRTDSNPISSNDWFNIFISDHTDVLAETKKALNLNAAKTADTIIKHLPLCVEISLQTVDQDKMVLEVWSLSISTSDQNNITANKSSAHAIYNRMGILLKSLISITRCTPAYKLSRRQSPDSYNIYYRIYVDEPQINNLGEGARTIQIGQLNTILGTLIMNVAFNTKMTISPQSAVRDNEILLKSDHFLKDSSPKRCHYVKKTEKKVIDLDKPLKPGAFVDAAKIKQFKEEDFILPETPPFHWLIKLSNTSKSESSLENGSHEEISEDSTTSVINNYNNNNNNNNVNLINFEIKKDLTSSTKSLLVALEENKPISQNKLPAEDDNLLKELHFPFASVSTRMGDLAKFYRECYHAPKLQCESLEELTTVDEVSKQLEEFETSLNDYESLVKSIGCSIDSNSNS